MSIAINKYSDKLNPLVLKNVNRLNKTLGCGEFEEFILDCPLCKSKFYRNVWLKLRHAETLKVKTINELSKSLLKHIEYKVRYQGDLEHLDFMIRIVGKEETIKLAHKWANHNILISKKIIEYIKKV